jgi:outer membrane protein OmpA-like peptidoglycan-associated protein
VEPDSLALEPPLEFDEKQLTLTDKQKLALGQVAELLTDYYPGMLLRLEGHADGEGKKQDNDRLSENRAKVVADYLREEGIDSERLVEKGYGEDRPIRREEGDKSRRENRRVELVIIVLEQK